MINIVIFILTVVIFTSVTTTITYYTDQTGTIMCNLFMNLTCWVVVIGGFIVYSVKVENETVNSMRSDGLSDDDIKSIKEL